MIHLLHHQDGDGTDAVATPGPAGPTASTAGDDEGIEPSRRPLALAVLLLCVLTASVDVTITNVALPEIGADLRASTSTLQWVIDSYNIVLAGLLLLGAGLADRLGRKRAYLTGYALFGLASLAAAFAPTAGALIAARATMGLGAALVMAPSLAILATIYPPAERPRAIALWVVAGSIGIAAGPVLGGLLLANLWWGSVFLVNVPVVALGVVLGARVLPESTKPDLGPLDVAGGLLSVGGLGAFLFGVIEGPQRGWTSPEVIAALVVGALLVAAFVVHERRSDHPMFDVTVLLRPAVAIGAGVLFLTYVSFTSMLFFVPQYLQAVIGWSVIGVGLLLVPFATACGLASWRVAALMRGIGVPTLVSGGLALLAAGAAALALAPRLGGTPVVVAATVVSGCGVGLLLTPASTITMNALPASRAGEGSATNMVSRYVGASMGVAALGTVFASVYASGFDGPLLRVDEATLAAARTSVHVALVDAAKLGGPTGQALADEARRSFDAGMGAAFAVVAVLCAAGCVVTLAMRRRLAEVTGAAGSGATVDAAA